MLAQVAFLKLGRQPTAIPSAAADALVFRVSVRSPPYGGPRDFTSSERDGVSEAMALDRSHAALHGRDGRCRPRRVGCDLGLDDRAGTLETDRKLRLGSPPPSSEQLGYSTALINQQVAELQGLLRPPRGDRFPT
jgi:hypothetical protein